MFRAVTRVATPIPLAGSTIAPTGEVIDAASVEVIIEVKDEGDHASLASPGQVHSDQEEDCMDVLMNAVHRRKLQTKARRASGSGAAYHHAPPPPLVQQPSAPAPTAPAHRAWTKRPAIGPPPGFTGVRQPPQKQHHAHPPQKQLQAQPPQKQDRQVWQHGPPPVAPNARRAPAAARAPTRAPVDTRSRKPPLHKRPTVPKPATAFMCGVCGVRCMSAFNLAQHEKGRKHRNRLACAAGEMNVQCEVCDVYLCGELNVREHNAGKQHLQQVFLSGLNGAAGN